MAADEELGANPEDWPDPDAEPIEYVRYSFKLLSNECECCLDHLGDFDNDHGQLVDAIMHLKNIVSGTQAIARVIIEQMGDEEKMALVKMTMEQANGVPVNVFMAAPGLIGVQEREVVVPDSLDGLVGEGDGGD